MSNSPLQFHSNLEQSINTQILSNNIQPTLASQPTFQNTLLRVIPKADACNLWIASLKITASLSILLLTSATCNQPIRLWLWMMIFYDLMVITGKLLNIEIDRNSSPARPVNAAQESAHDETLLLPVSNALGIEHHDEEAQLLNPDLNQDHGQNNFPRKTLIYKKILVLIGKYSPWYYIFLFFYGNSFLFDTNSDCATNAPLINRLATIFLILQYIGISLPLILCCSCCCVCIVALVVGLRGVFQSQHQAQINQTIIDTLPVQKYPIDLSGDPECSICMCVYENGDDIVQLDCSRMHHFHDLCIKKWLRVNGVCPICRTKLEDMKKKKNSTHPHDHENPKAR